MTSAQECLVFPLISLHSKHQLLVVSIKNNRTHKEHIELITLRQKDAQIKDNIKFPKTKSLEVIMSNTDALTQFNRIFNVMTKGECSRFSLRKKIIKTFDYSGRLHTTHKEIIDHVCRLSREFSIHLLNIQDFATQFIKINIPTMMQKIESRFTIKTLYHVAETMYNEIMATNMAACELLEQAEKKQASKLYWAINEVKIRYETENIIRKHNLHLLKTSLDAPKPLLAPQELILQLLKDLNAIEKNKFNMSSFDQYHLVMNGFLPIFDTQEKTLSAGVKNRILTINAYRKEMIILRHFQETLMKDFPSLIYPSSSSDEELLDDKDITST